MELSSLPQPKQPMFKQAIPGASHLSPAQLEQVLQQTLTNAGLTPDEQRIFIDSEIHKKSIWQVICEIWLPKQDVDSVTQQINGLYDSAVAKLQAVIGK